MLAAHKWPPTTSAKKQSGTLLIREITVCVRGRGRFILVEVESNGTQYAQLKESTGTQNLESSQRESPPKSEERERSFFLEQLCTKPTKTPTLTADKHSCSITRTANSHCLPRDCCEER